MLAAWATDTDGNLIPLLRRTDLSQLLKCQ